MTQNSKLTARLANEILFIVNTLDPEAAQPLIEDILAPLVRCYVDLGGVYNLCQGGALKMVFPIADDLKSALVGVREVVDSLTDNEVKP